MKVDPNPEIDVLFLHPARVVNAGATFTPSTVTVLRSPAAFRAGPR
jgi:hypothetical protein